MARFDTMTKAEIIKEVLKQIRKDLDEYDVTSLVVMLMSLQDETLIEYLPKSITEV